MSDVLVSLVLKVEHCQMFDLQHASPRFPLYVVSVQIDKQACFDLGIQTHRA